MLDFCYQRIREFVRFSRSRLASRRDEKIARYLLGKRTLSTVVQIATDLKFAPSQVRESLARLNDTGRALRIDVDEIKDGLWKLDDE